MGVGQLIDKLFGGGPAVQNEAVLRAYGKLPFYAEYRRLEVSPGAPTIYSQWLDEGRLSWVRSPNKSESGATLHSRLLIMLPETKELVVASVWDSRDNLGRVFPFSFFVTCPPESLGETPIERWTAASSIHRAFDRLYSSLHTLASGGDFYKRFRKHMVTLKPDDLAERVAALRDDAAAIQAADWFKGLGLGDDVDAGAWFNGVGARGRRWKKQSESAGEAALACPLAQGVPVSAQATAWLDWLDPLCRRSGKSPSLIMPGDIDKTPLDFIYLLRPPLPDDYHLLTTDGRAYGYVEHLAAVPEADASDAPAIAAPAGPLAAWLKANQP